MVAFQAPPRPKKKKKKAESCWTLIIFYTSSRTIAKCYHSECIPFLFISFLSVSTSKVLAQILSVLMPGVPSPRTEDNIHYLTHWIWQMSLNWFRSLRKAQMYGALWGWPGHIRCAAVWTIPPPRPFTFHRTFWSSPPWQKVTSGLSQMSLNLKAVSATNSVKWVATLTLPVPQFPHLWAGGDVTGGFRWDGKCQHFTTSSCPALPQHPLYHDHRDFSLLLDNICIFIR